MAIVKNNMIEPYNWPAKGAAVV